MSDVSHIVCPHCFANNRLPSDRLGSSPSCGKCKKPLFTGQVATLTAPSFQVLEPNIRLAKINIDSEQAIANRFNIQSIPTMACFYQGKEVARQNGAMDTASIVRWAQSASERI